jgi:hypothetical protein
VIWDTTSRGLCGRTSERGGKGYCVKGGRGEEGERVKERAHCDGARVTVVISGAFIKNLLHNHSVNIK